MVSTRNAAAREAAEAVIHEDETATDAPTEPQQATSEGSSRGALVELTTNLPEFNPNPEQTEKKSKGKRKKKAGKKAKDDREAPHGRSGDEASASSNEGRSSDGTIEVLEDENSIPESPASLETTLLLEDMPINDAVVVKSTPSSPKPITLPASLGGEAMSDLDLNSAAKKKTTPIALSIVKQRAKNFEVAKPGKGETVEEKKQHVDHPGTSSGSEADVSSSAEKDKSPLAAKQSDPKLATGTVKRTPAATKGFAPKRAVTTTTPRAGALSSKPEPKRSNTVRPSVSGSGVKPQSSVASKNATNSSAFTATKQSSPAARTPAKPIKKENAKPRPTINALNTPPPIAKSTKPPTKSTFELPGEAVRARLKAQREERLKKQQEEEGKTKTFKARPIAKVKPVEVRGTTASRARMSLAAEQKTDVTDASLKAAGAPAKRASSFAGPSRPAPKSRPSLPATRPALSKASPTGTVRAKATEANRKASIYNWPIKTITAASPHAGPARRITSAAGNKPTPLVSPPDAQTTTKGKTVFNRDRIDKEENDKAMKEKAEAAKRARAEAAERGRIASREWAEKKRAQAAASKALSQKSATDANAAAAQERPVEGDGVTAPGSSTKVPTVTVELI